MIDYVFELPYNNPTSGGVQHTLGVATKMDAHVRFNRISNRESPKFPAMSVGLPDNAFPECEYAITYSDSRQLAKLLALPQVGKVAVLMLSYGMVIEWERANIHMDGVTVMTSTRRNQELIEMEGVECHRVGFGFDPSPFHMTSPYQSTPRLAALYRHPRPEKGYTMALRVATELCQRGTLDGFVTFGPELVELDDIRSEQYCTGHVRNAAPIELCQLFNACSVFIMPSITEGLNRTPAEATLCGCPSVLCDGALDELYFPDWNCKWVQGNDADAVLHAAEYIVQHPHDAPLWADRMQQQVAPYTFEAMAVKIKAVMEEAGRI
jgi:glycosyltransferase involved in cell wall biosynthesis